MKGGCYVLPFAAIDIQPYQNQIGRQWILTPLDNNVGDNNNSHYKNKHIDNLIDAMTINQSRENNSSQLKYIIHGKFRVNCDGKNSLFHQMD